MHGQAAGHMLEEVKDRKADSSTHLDSSPKHSGAQGGDMARW